MKTGNSTNVELRQNWTSNPPDLFLPISDYTRRTVGDKRYELSNHLGNVLEVISDRKVRFTDNGTLVYAADVVSYADYSPYGTLLGGRHGDDNNYRFGFQGQERDDEIKGAGNSLNYEYRMHDPRIGRFFVVDPLAPEYPELTPYQFSSNCPIGMVEIEGLEGQWVSQGVLAHEKTMDKAKLSQSQKAKARLQLYDGFKVVGQIAVVCVAIVGVGYAVITYGVVAVGTYVLEEAGEYVFEEITHIPVITDPLDVLEQIYKKGGKKFAKEVFVEGRKFIDVKRARDWVYNVKNYGRNLAEMISRGKLTVSEAKAFKELAVDRQAFKSFNEMTESELAAFNHAISRHGSEFGLKWGKKETLPNLVEDFNKKVSEIREKGNMVGTKKVDYGVKGAGVSSTKVDAFVYEYVNESGQKYYYHETLEGQFISSGLSTTP